MRKYVPSGFTLIELVVAITIFAIIMVSIFAIYVNIVSTNKKLELTRRLQDNVRLITETVASDVRDQGVDFGAYSLMAAAGYGLDYAGSGNTILAIKGGIEYFAVNESGVICTSADLADPRVSCTFGRRDGGIVELVGTSDAKIRNLRFYISGADPDAITSEDFVPKVLVSFEIGIASGKGLASRWAEPSYIRVQTVISEKPYKSF
ncbi:MAG TPA: prepilin-type N-terminal cleavage/methylation domain-containing protein [bacterium]|nr:prepilin-type N-terminal cleavage/methylation domain-containing protein [bacterium]